ncbi:hypothetical protein BGX34_012222 [Mortierella sp. NVP85]|nr:hypothetical protein BGX34_012222 [Mortierella sp. NVP85]
MFTPSFLTSLSSFLGLDDARFMPSDWSFERNPFWTTYLLTLIVFPCLFYFSWYMNPSLTKNRLGLSWVMGFYSATLFTIAGIYEVPHLRTIFNAAVDYRPAETSASIVTIPSVTNAMVTLSASAEVLDLTMAAARDICYPILKTGALALVATLPSFLRLDTGSPSKYYCFSDLSQPLGSNETIMTWMVSSPPTSPPASPPASPPTGSIGSTHTSPNVDTIRQYHPHHPQQQHPQQQHPQQQHSTGDSPLSLRHRIYQGQMQRPHLIFSLENYPDDGRIGPHIVAANFQAFLLVDLILGFLHYRKQLEPFSTVVHHIIYYFIVIHMRAGDMLSVFCICGTPIEASSIFLAFGRMFPHRRTPLVEWLYVLCFVSTRLIYVALLWHEVYFNYPDKSVAFLYSITISLHIYWFVLYLQTQRRFRAKQRSKQLKTVLQSLANTANAECVASIAGTAKMVMGTLKDEFRTNDCLVLSTTTTVTTKRRRLSSRMAEADRQWYDENENRVSVELSEREQQRPLIARDLLSRGGAQVV